MQITDTLMLNGYNLQTLAQNQLESKRNENIFNNLIIIFSSSIANFILKMMFIFLYKISDFNMPFLEIEFDLKL